MPMPSNRFSWQFVVAVALSVLPSAAATPDWVRKAASATLPSYDPETNAVVLLDDVNIRVVNVGEYVEHYRRVVKILRPEGREEADIGVYLDTKEKLHSIHCWSFDRSG